jgi:hypothetical protein
MDSKTTSQWVYPVASCAVRHGPLPSSTPECDPTPRLNRGETLLLVLLLSLGVWALIWAGISLFGADGLR